MIVNGSNVTSLPVGSNIKRVGLRFGGSRLQ